MNRYLFPFYRIVVPKPLRTLILKRSLRKKILDYLSGIPETNISSEQKEVLSYLVNNPVKIFPYPFQDNYSPGSIEVNYDNERKLRYVMLDDKRLYFKKRWGENRIKRAWSDLLREQDPKSPHRYLDNSFEIGENDVLADIGAAEGNFSLSVIEKVKKIYLFEYDPQWVEALKATFEQYSSKVEIICKYVSDKDDESHIRMDTFFKENNDITFMKIDVDGAEDKVLRSCTGIFQSVIPLKIALCTYHKNDDEKHFTALLKNNAFKVTTSQGYMIHFYDKKMKAPYLRRGLIRAVRP